LSYGLFFTIPVERREPASSPEVHFMETASGTPAVDYIGLAPRRFIVHAERIANVSERSHTTATQEDDTR